jgi:hypothetical protein
MALSVTTAGAADPNFFSANGVLPGCKKVVAEPDRITIEALHDAWRADGG